MSGALIRRRHLITPSRRKRTIGKSKTAYRHGNVLDEVLREEIKDLTPEQVKQVLEYIETLKQQ